MTIIDKTRQADEMGGDKGRGREGRGGRMEGMDEEGVCHDL